MTRMTELTHRDQCTETANLTTSDLKETMSVLTPAPHSSVRPRQRSLVNNPHRQAGVALMTMAVALVLFGAVLLAGTLAMQSRGGGKTATDQQLQARQAEQAINGFAAVYGRAPCPSVRKNGPEDCSGPAKGWLPVETLEKTGLLFGAPAEQQADVRYLVYRGHGSYDPDPDLAEPAPYLSGAVGTGSASGFVPSVVDASALPGYPAISSSVDLCGKLRSLLPNPDPSRRWESGDPVLDGPGRVDRAHIPLPAAPGGAAVLMNVAYAVAVAAPDQARPVPDVNANFSVLKMESPANPPPGGHYDVVRVVDPRAFYRTLACGAAIASLDNLAVATSWSADAAGLRQGNIDGGKQIMDMGIPIAVGDGAFVISEVIDTWSMSR
ncbi:MAG: hypothetical protein EOO28_29655 [Comamonadaceae bacterium]|nr:MAG: hypothetical protein EOO28_29655 [Comamonadaceae bacterium]